MKILLPLMTNSSPSRLYMVAIPPASLPAFGSVSRRQPITLAGIERRQPFLLLLFGAEGVDRVGGKRGVRRDQHAARTASLGDLFHHNDVGEHVQAGAAVLLGKIAPHEAHFTHLFDQRVGNRVLFVDFYGNRLDLFFDEIAHGRLQYLVILAQLEIHGSNLLSSVVS